MALVHLMKWGFWKENSMREVQKKSKEVGGGWGRVHACFSGNHCNKFPGDA